MNTDGHGSEFPDTALTHDIIGASFEVLNELGHGLREKAYENALIVELELRKRTCAKQRSFEVFYKSVRVDEYIPDLLVDENVIVDAKTVEKIGDLERGQMLNYLRVTKRRLGLIINFKRPKLEWERIVL